MKLTVKKVEDSFVGSLREVKIKVTEPKRRAYVYYVRFEDTKRKAS